MSYAPITDPTNPFNTTGISDEVRAMLSYLLHVDAAGLQVVATSTTDHAKYSNAGYVSRHRQMGTNGEGLAIDCRLARRGNDIHRAVFDAFVPVEAQLHELVYAGAPYNIKSGRRVPPYAVSSHHDHVHVSVNRGTLLRWPGRPAPTEVKPMFDPPAVLEPIVAACACPTGGAWLAASNGAVYAFGGAPYQGGANAGPLAPHFAGRKVARIEPNSRGGYDLISTSNERYSLPV